MFTARKDCKSEAGDLFAKLSRLREESHKTLSFIIDSHSNSIQSGINELMEEIRNLQAKLAMMTQEKDELVQTTDKLREEMRQLLTAQLSNNQTVTPKSTEELSHVEDSKLSDVIDNNISEEIEGSENNKAYELDDPLDTLGLDVTVKQEQVVMNEVITNDQAEESPQEREDTSDYHYRYIDSDLNKKGIRREYQCNLCPKTSLMRSHMKRHIKGVHSKIKDQECDQCEYAAADKGTLSQHKLTMHKSGYKKFKCDTCPYTTNKKYNLKMHIDGVHKKIKKHKCEECGVGILLKAQLRLHMESVHKMGEKLRCDQCPFTSYSKPSLKLHVAGVHDKIRKYVCEQCPFTSLRKGNLNIHIRDVHMKTGQNKSKQIVSNCSND